MKKTFSCLVLLSLLGLDAVASDNRSLRVWFDKPNPVVETFAWEKSSVVERAGEGANAEPAWETQSLPIGNGSLGANVMGVVSTERLTFNEKSLWRGGPNTAKGPQYYWDVNKESAGVLKEIRQAFIDGDQ